jgi:DnaK suppressor protein
MNSTNISRLQQKLGRDRDQLVASLHRLNGETREVDPDYPQDVGDFCLSSLSKESLFQERTRLQGRLRMIERALDRIVEGSFGVCLTCGDEIEGRRLEAVPWASNCLHCQERLEEQRRVDCAPGVQSFSAIHRVAM